MKTTVTLLLAAAGLALQMVGTTAMAQQTPASACIKIEAGKPLQLDDSPNPLPTPVSSARLLVFPKPIGGASPQPIHVAPAAAGASFTPSEAFVSAVLDQLTPLAASDRSKFVLAFVDSAGAVQTLGGGYPFYLAATEGGAPKKAAACGTAPTVAAIAGGGGIAKPLGRLECIAEAKRLGMLDQPYRSWLVFDSTGTLCQAPDVLPQRNRLHFAMMWRQGETVQSSASATVENCKAPTASPVILGNAADLKPLLQSGSVAAQPIETREIAMPVECASDSIKITVVVPQDDGKTATRVYTPALPARYSATVHLGVLSSRLRDPDYGLRTLNGQTTIVDRESQDRAPEYVATLVIQAIPRYFMNGGGLSYPGRDILHDNNPADRLGLAFSFGLKDPAKRFGLGLSYEIAKGVNVVGIHEWVKTNRLNGVGVGDTFAGAAADIPTRKEWRKGWSFGLTFDIDYVTKVFGASGK